MPVGYRHEYSLSPQDQQELAGSKTRGGSEQQKKQDKVTISHTLEIQSVGQSGFGERHSTATKNIRNLPACPKPALSNLVHVIAQNHDHVFVTGKLPDR